MNDDSEKFSASETPAPMKRPYSEAILQDAIEQLNARGDSVKRMACMQLPVQIFNDLCARLIDRSKNVKETAEWLNEELLERDLPTIGRSSVDRFSDALFEEYRRAMFKRSRQKAEQYNADLTAGDPEAHVMALNGRLTELVSEALLDVDSLDDMDDGRLEALTSAAKVVAQVKFGKKYLDAKIKTLEQQILERDANIRLKDQKLKLIPDRVKAVENKLRGIQESLKRGEKILPEIYEAIYQELTTIKSEAGVAA